MRKFVAIGMLCILFSACGPSEQAYESAEVSRVSETTTAETEVQTTTVEPATEAVTQPETEVPTTTAAPEPVDYEALGVNEQGHIMVVMYHGIMDNPPYHRTEENFLKDLNYFYDHGYRLISMADYISGHISVPAGMTPIVFTFDDGLSTTFSLEETNEGLDVVSGTAVGLIEDFYKKNPDFGRSASFYIHATSSNFRGAGSDMERLQWLVDRGYEIGNHSATHANFKKLGREGLLKEVGEVEVYLHGLMPEYEMTSMTYPFGARPDSSLLHLLQEGSYEGHELTYDVAFREGPSGQFYPSVHKKFNPLNTPRVRGSEGDIQDLWWFLDYYEENPSLKYVSDGDPMTIVVPENKADNIAEDLDKAFEIITY